MKLTPVVFVIKDRIEFALKDFSENGLFSQTFFSLLQIFFCGEKVDLADISKIKKKKFKSC